MALSKASLLVQLNSVNLSLTIRIEKIIIKQEHMSSRFSRFSRCPKLTRFSRFSKSTDSPGEDGIDGVNGTNGLPGPSGITQLINGTNVYLVTNSTGAAGGATLQALCQTGDFVINGGYNLSGGVSTDMIISQNEPIVLPSGAGWIVNLVNAPSLTILTVHAYCFDNSP